MRMPSPRGTGSSWASLGLHCSQQHGVSGAQSCCPVSHQPLLFLGSSTSSGGISRAQEQHGHQDSPHVQDPSAVATPSYLLARGCPRGRAKRCCARLPRLPRPHTARVTPEEMGSVLGRKSKQRAPRCWSMSCAHAPRGCHSFPAPRLPQPTSQLAVGPPGGSGGALGSQGLGGHHCQTQQTLHPKTMLTAPAAREGGWVRILAPQAGLIGMTQLLGCQALAPWSSPGCRVPAAHHGH